MPAIIATVGGATSNSYETQAEANTYFDERIALPTPWVTTGDAAIRALITATRTLDMMAFAHRRLVVGKSGQYIIVSRTWTGTPATVTQRLAWPRIGMFDQNGNAIDATVIPQALKDAESELAGQLLITDTLLDNATIVGGITSVRAGSVSVTFKDDLLAHVLPDAVMNLMPQSWFTEEYIEQAQFAEFILV